MKGTTVPSAGAVRIARDGTILRGTVGSTAHGLHLESQDDYDEMAVMLEPPEYLLGLGRLDHALERTQPEGARSGPGDLDLILYSARKYARLALNGNPTVLLLLYTPSVVAATELGWELRELTPAFLSRSVGHRYRGYLDSQRRRLVESHDERSTNRPELIEAHGFDTKYAMHALRLAIQGREMLESGRLTLPLPEPDRSRILAVRRGEAPYAEVLAWLGEAEAALVRAHEQTRLPEQPDTHRVEAWLVHAYLTAWRGLGEPA